MSARELGRRLLLWAVVVVAIIAVAVTVLYHEEASGWPWTGPQWLHLCGRDYEKVGSPITLARLDEQTRGRVQLYRAYRVLPVVGPEVYADTKPTARAHAPGEPCSGSLYTRTGSKIQVFNLSGGA